MAWMLPGQRRQIHPATQPSVTTAAQTNAPLRAPDSTVLMQFAFQGAVREAMAVVTGLTRSVQAHLAAHSILTDGGK